MPKKTVQSSSDQRPKATYRITNWADYNTALIQRGSLTIWFNVEALEQWKSPTQTGHPGHPFEYGDVAIECALTLKAVYGLPFRQTQGVFRVHLATRASGLGCARLYHAVSSPEDGRGTTRGPVGDPAASRGH